MGAANLSEASGGPSLLLEPTVALLFLNTGTTKPATSGFGLKANAQYAGDALRFAVGPAGFVHFVGASAGVVYERVRKADASSEFLTHRGVEGTVFLTAGRFVSLYGRQAYVPGSSQPVRTDAGLQLLLRWQDLETIAGIIEFFTP